MSLKDQIIRLWIQRVILPKIEIIDQPGFLITQASRKGARTYLRLLFLPERFFIILENRAIQKNGDAGKKVLYSIGKKFGYLYANLSNFPNLKNSAEKEVLNFTGFFTGLLGVTYAKNVKYSIKKEEKKLVFTADEYLVCRSNGHGYLWAAGGSAGIWSYMMVDPSIESVQIKCVGRGDDSCEIISAPPNILRREELEFFTETNVPTITESQAYERMNKIRHADYAKNSLKSLMDAGFLDYNRGEMMYRKFRYFMCESHLIYVLEDEFKKSKDGQRVLFDSAFDCGFELAQEEKKLEFISDFLPALGWGDMVVTKSNGKFNVICNHFPWSRYSENSDLVIFRGILSGMLSSLKGKRIFLEKTTASTASGSLALILTETGKLSWT
ncbi:MAG: hypothetical protein V1921_02085 [Candidatus Altiarchaeota archaeon]